MRRILCVVLAAVVLAGCTNGVAPRATTDPENGGRVVIATPHSVVVPDLRGLSEVEAIRALVRADLVPGEWTARYNDRVAVGQVVGTQPVEGKRVPARTVVDYTISLGSEPEAQRRAPAPDPTHEPTARPTATPTAPPTPIAVRDFGFGDAFDRSGDSVRLTGRSTRHRTTDRIAWRIGLPSTDPSTELRITVTRESDGTVVARVNATTEGRRVVYGRLPRLSRPGTYVVRLYADGDRLDTARLTISPPATPRPTPRPTRRPRPRRGCDPSYPTVCIPRSPPDLDCGDISFRRFRVIGRDPHRFDADNDGIGCESG